jgi:hypothetical protein
VAPHLPFSHLFGALHDAICGMKFETDDDVSCAVRSLLTTRAEQGNVPTWYTHTCSSFVRGRRKWTETLWKNGYRFKPSLFLLCDFHYLGINIYREKKLVALLSGHTLHISAVTILILSCPSIASYHPYIRVSIRLGYNRGKLLFYYSCMYCSLGS